MGDYLNFPMSLSMGNYGAPLAQIGGVPSLQSMSDSLPGMASQSPFSMIGNALMKGSQGQDPGLSGSHLNAQPMQSTGLLERLLGALTQRRF